VLQRGRRTAGSSSLLLAALAVLTVSTARANMGVPSNPGDPVGEPAPATRDIVVRSRVVAEFAERGPTGTPRASRFFAPLANNSGPPTEKPKALASRAVTWQAVVLACLWLARGTGQPPNARRN
jgi:hypothetical protein